MLWTECFLLLDSHLGRAASVTSREVMPGVVLDLDEGGALVGIDIDHASPQLDLPNTKSGSVPFEAVG